MEADDKYNNAINDLKMLLKRLEIYKEENTYIEKKLKELKTENERLRKGLPPAPLHPFNMNFN